MSDELIELPEGWEWTTAVKACSKVIDCHNKTAPYITSGIKLVRTSNIRNGLIKLDDTKFVDQPTYEFWSRRCFPEPGDILFTREAPMAEVGMILDEEKLCMGQRMMLLRSDSKNLSGKYLLYTLQSSFIHNYANRVAVGSGVKHLRVKDVEQLPIPLPPLNEQKRIVKTIEQLRERSQKALSALSAIPELCNHFRQSVLAAAFRGDLTADWREQNPDVEPASVLLERIRCDRQQKLIKTKISLEEINLLEFPCIPQTWAWEHLVNISNLVGGVAKGRKFNGQSTVHVSYLRVANVQDGFLNLEEIKEIEVLPEDTYKYRLEYGDVLFTEGGDRDKLGRGTVWKNEIQGCIHQNHIYRARLQSSDILPEYVSLAAKTEYAKDYFFQNASQTTNLASINITTLGKLPLPIPPLREQKEICSRVNDLLKLAESLKSTYKEILSGAEQLDRAILAKAFRGELVEQDPNDEPAAILLDRIRAEREQLAKTEKKTKSRRTTKPSQPSQ